MLPQILEQTKLTHLQQLVTDGEQEGKYIEYKDTLYRLDTTDPKDRTKQHEELLKDVSSFANTEGGDLILGMAEESGAPVEPHGVECENPDDVKLKYLQLIQSWIEPRITVHMHFVRRDDGRSLFIIRIVKSLLAPHRVVYANYPGQFWARNSAGAYMMDTTELRRSFTLSESVFDRMRSFHRQRVEDAINQDTPVLIAEGPKLVLHLIPFSSFTSRQLLDLSSIQRLERKLPPLGGATNWVSRINLDGVATHDIYDHKIASFAYVQAFRNGIIESVANEIASKQNRSDDHTLYFQNSYLSNLRDVLPTYLEFQKEIGIPTPIWLFVTLTDMKGVELYHRRSHLKLLPAVDRSILSLPEAEISSHETHVETVLKPLIDMIWNAFGLPKEPG